MRSIIWGVFCLGGRYGALMTALEDARADLPEAATITRDLLDFFIEKSGGNGTIAVAPGTLAKKLVSTVDALERRIIAIEEALTPGDDDGGWEFTEEPSPFSAK